MQYKKKRRHKGRDMYCNGVLFLEVDRLRVIMLQVPVEVGRNTTPCSVCTVSCMWFRSPAMASASNIVKIRRSFSDIPETESYTLILAIAMSGGFGTVRRINRLPSAWKMPPSPLVRARDRATSAARGTGAGQRSATQGGASMPCGRGFSASAVGLCCTAAGRGGGTPAAAGGSGT